jgi:hypothetical protein
MDKANQETLKKAKNEIKIPTVDQLREWYTITDLREVEEVLS